MGRNRGGECITVSGSATVSCSVKVPIAALDQPRARSGTIQARSV